MPRALVTGARGFVGRHLCARLATDGWAVHRVGRSSDAPEGPGAWHGVDLANLDAVRALVADVQPEAVFHLAAHVTGSRAPESVAEAVRGNYLATANLLDACQATGVGRLVLTGSLEEPDADASARAVPASPYAATKWGASALGRMYHALYDLPVVILRLFMVYGPGDQPHRVIPHIIDHLRRGESPALSSGTRAVDWIYVDDVVEAFLAAARAPDAPGGTFDVGTGVLTTIREVAERLQALIAPDVPLGLGQIPDRPLERETAADPGPTRDGIGWSPGVDVGDGLRRVAGGDSGLLRRA